ncbi:MAG: hypothetical protein ABI369_05950 [Acetobacteraceae bacterium]
MRRGAAASLTLHVLVVAALLLGLPLGRPPEAPPETAVDMVFQAPGPATKAPAPAAVPAPAPTPLPLPAPPAPTPPTPAPLEDTTPPPPPPPPPPTPAVVQPPPTPIIPPLRPAPAPAIATPAPPPKPMPPPPLPPLPMPPPPAPPSPTAQPNPTVNPAPSSPALENTLEKLRAQAHQQTRAPLARPNPRQGGAPNAGGDPSANDTSALSASERGAIGDHVRPCWTTDPGALDLDKMQVLLTVTTDATGVVRRAEVAPADQERLSDPRLRVFSERAVRAVLSPACANLPLPAKLLGKVNVLTFRFRP